MLEQEILAKVELEIEYGLRPSSVLEKLAALYENETGVKPAKDLHLLDWFFDNYRFNHETSSWYSMNTVTFH